MIIIKDHHICETFEFSQQLYSFPVPTHDFTSWHENKYKICMGQYIQLVCPRKLCVIDNLLEEGSSCDMIIKTQSYYKKSSSFSQPHD